MVEPPDLSKAAVLDEKQPQIKSRDHAFKPRSTPTTPTTSSNEKSNGNDPPPFRSFDVDLESQHGPPNTTAGSTVHIPKTNTLHSNASSPADLGIGDENAFEEEGGFRSAARGRARRRDRARRNPNAVVPVAPHVEIAPGTLPSRRRAQSLPSRQAPGATVTVPGTLPPYPMAKALGGLLQPDHKLAPPPGWKTSFINIATYSYINLMLIFVPIAWGVVSRCIFWDVQKLMRDLALRRVEAHNRLCV